MKKDVNDTHTEFAWRVISHFQDARTNKPRNNELRKTKFTLRTMTMHPASLMACLLGSFTLHMQGSIPVKLPINGEMMNKSKRVCHLVIHLLGFRSYLFLHRVI